MLGRLLYRIFSRKRGPLGAMEENTSVPGSIYHTWNYQYEEDLELRLELMGKAHGFDSRQVCGDVYKLKTEVERLTKLAEARCGDCRSWKCKPTYVRTGDCQHEANLLGDPQYPVYRQTDCDSRCEHFEKREEE